MSIPAGMEKRLRFFGINSKTKRAINGFLPVVLPKIDSIADRWYGYTLNFPEARRILAPHYSNNILKEKQIKHWVKLFSLRFDQEFLSYSLKIGKIHYINKVSPYLYIGGYNFIQCELMELIMAHYKEAEERSAALNGLNQLIAFDMDLALSAYTREHWLHDSEKTDAKDSKSTAEKTLESNTVLVC